MRLLIRKNLKITQKRLDIAARYAIISSERRCKAISRKQKKNRGNEALRLAILAAALEVLAAMIEFAKTIIDAMNR